MDLRPVSRRLKRLRTAVEVRSLGALPAGADEGSEIAARVERHLQRAREAARARRINEGWGHLHEAERLGVLLADPSDLAATAAELRREAADSDKFSPWRRNAILEHLADGNGRAVAATDVQHALRLRSEHFDNVYSKIDETLFWIALASVVVVVILGALGAGSLAGWLALPPETMGLMATTILMGGLGAALSTGLSLTRAEAKRSIPDVLLEGAVTAFRPVLGGAMAAVTFVFIQAGLLDFLGEGIAARPWLIAALGFVAGYSERWFIGMVAAITESRISREDEPTEPATPRSSQ